MNLKNNMKIKEILHVIKLIVIAVLIFDVLCFLAWVLSGQTPVDGFYFGFITNNVLKIYN